VDGGERPQESSLQGADIKRRRLGLKAGIATMTTDDIIEKNTCGGGQF
jgi:hypothetical protein